MHTVFALLCFVVVIHWLIFPYPSGLLHWHCGNLTIAPMPAKQPWWIWINTSCEFIMNDCITTTKQSTTKPCGYFLGYTVFVWFPYLYTEGLVHHWGIPIANTLKILLSCTKPSTRGCCCKWLWWDCVDCHYHSYFPYSPHHETWLAMYSEQYRITLHFQWWPSNITDKGLQYTPNTHSLWALLPVRISW